MELRDLQLVELELLIEFRDFCDKNNLKYYISGGTFLGAIRHKGFIPWDDDVDVAMPRKDYDTFVEKASQYFDGDHKLWHFSLTPESRRPNSRLVDTKTFIRNNSWKESRVEPVWIDIFPLDGLPESSVLSTIHKIRLLFRKMLIGFANYENIQDNKKDRKMYEKLLIKINSIFGFGKRLDVYQQYHLIEKDLRRYSNERSKVYFNFHGAYRFKSIMNIEKIYGDGMQVEFEGNYFLAPAKFDEYLKQIYGDYMKLPDEESRNKHNTEVIDL